MAPPVIIGAGLAGLSVALTLAPKPVVVLGRKMIPGLTSSSLAQGGLAAAVGEGDDPGRHALDTLRAGAGLCDPFIVEMITGEGPSAVERLLSWGAPFDRDEGGRLKTGLEGAHSCRRVVHAKGDGTGAAIMKALIAKARATPSITFFEDAEATRLVSDSTGAISGVVFRRGGEEAETVLPAENVVLATGSACALWADTTVPSGSWGRGLALAAQAGARLRDLEMAQFHPTALASRQDPLPLISEAVRGEGAWLVDETGERFTDELASRDLVARAIEARREMGRRVFLDASRISSFASRFPAITGYCAEAGIDPARDWIPIRPVAHYHMGGIATDSLGRTNVAGLWACGECACTGLHGANRLASNSLLEAAVMGHRVGVALRSLAGDRALFPLLRWTGEPSRGEGGQARAVREKIGAGLGVRRDGAGLSALSERLAILAPRSARAFVGLMIARTALARTESRGGHYRTDFPEADAGQAASLETWIERGEIKVEKRAAPEKWSKALP